MIPHELRQALVEILGDPALQKSVAYVVVCFIGQLAYAAKLWIWKEIDCVWDRFRHDPRATAQALITNMTVIIGVVALIDIGATPWKTVLVLALSQGIGADSAVNKSARKVWTESERVEKQINQPTKESP